MKKEKTIISFSILGILSYFLIDFYKTKYDRIARYAAGESLYEKTHQKD